MTYEEMRKVQNNIPYMYALFRLSRVLDWMPCYSIVEGEYYYMSDDTYFGSITRLKNCENYVDTAHAFEFCRYVTKDELLDLQHQQAEMIG